MTGTALKQARRDSGYQAQYLAKHLGMQNSSYSILESRTTPLKLSFNQWATIKRLLKLEDEDLEDHP